MTAGFKEQTLAEIRYENLRIKTNCPSSCIFMASEHVERSMKVALAITFYGNTLFVNISKCIMHEQTMNNTDFSIFINFC